MWNLNVDIVLTAIPAILLCSTSNEIKSYKLETIQLTLCFIFSFFILLGLDANVFQSIYLYCLSVIAVIDAKAREIPNDFTLALVIISLFSAPYFSEFSFLVYTIFMVIFYLCTLSGYVGGGDFKLYCSMLLVFSGIHFVILIIITSLLSVFGLFNNRNDNTVPMGPYLYVGIVFSFLFV